MQTQLFKNQPLNNANAIRSVSYSQTQILEWIQELYCPFGFDLDCTYSKGNFYKNINRPAIKTDLNPSVKGCMAADSRFLPFKNSVFRSVVYDPPFVIGSGPSLNKPQKDQNITLNRFSGFRSYQELFQYYQLTIKDIYRCLRQDGWMIVKTQDVVACGNQHISHLFILNTAEQIGFYCKDIFILLRENVLFSGKVKRQQHARKYHSYFIVFQKTKSPVNHHW